MMMQYNCVLFNRNNSAFAQKASKGAKRMGLIPGMHGGGGEGRTGSRHEMGNAILEPVSTAMSFATAHAAFLEHIGTAVRRSVHGHGARITALPLHMIAPGPLSRAMPRFIK
jgi:hypothetical protein